VTRPRSEADIQWARALHRGERLRLFPEWSMWVGLTAITLLLAAPLVAGIVAFIRPSLLSQTKPPLLVPYMISSIILLAFIAAAWGQKLNCAIQLKAGELHYWDWRRREHRVPWPQVKTITPHLLLWRITLGVDADGTRSRLAIDYGADVRRDAIIAEIARRSGLESERPLASGAPLGACRWRTRPPPPPPRPRGRKHAGRQGSRDARPPDSRQAQR
jgi:hypothetical protein